MIDQDAIYVELKPIFSDVFERDNIVLRPDLNAHDVEGWDSMKQIELLLALEQRFAMKFTSKEVDLMRNLGDISTIVAARGTIPSPGH